MKNNRHDEVCPDKCELSEEELMLSTALDKHFTLDNCCGKLTFTSAGMLTLMLVDIGKGQIPVFYKCQKCSKCVEIRCKI